MADPLLDSVKSDLDSVFDSWDALKKKKPAPPQAPVTAPPQVDYDFTFDDIGLESLETELNKLKNLAGPQDPLPAKPVFRPTVLSNPSQSHSSNGLSYLSATSTPSGQPPSILGSMSFQQPSPGPAVGRPLPMLGNLGGVGAPLVLTPGSISGAPPRRPSVATTPLPKTPMVQVGVTPVQQPYSEPITTTPPLVSSAPDPTPQSPALVRPESVSNGMPTIASTPPRSESPLPSVVPTTPPPQPLFQQPVQSQVSVQHHSFTQPPVAPVAQHASYGAHPTPTAAATTTAAERKQNRLSAVNLTMDATGVPQLAPMVAPSSTSNTFGATLMMQPQDFQAVPTIQPRPRGASMMALPKKPLAAHLQPEIAIPAVHSPAPAHNSPSPPPFLQVQLSDSDPNLFSSGAPRPDYTTHRSASAPRPHPSGHSPATPAPSSVPLPVYQQPITQAAPTVLPVQAQQQPSQPPSRMAPPIPTSETQHQLPMQTRATPYLSFEELLLDPKFGFLKGLASVMQVTEAAKVCQGVVKIFLKHDRAVELIRALIINEVGSQTTAGTLFRNNSVATHMMTAYSKAVGLPYLKNTIGPEILSIVENLDERLASYEIDPDKLKPKEDVKKNTAALKGLVHKFFDRILNSRSMCPKSFMEICHTLQTATKERFPDSKYVVIGGFLFLRYICPAIVAPDGYKLVPNIKEDARRVLVLVSKILQTIANEREFGDKEEYMQCMNPLVHEYKSMLQYFLNSLAKPPDPAHPKNIPDLPITFEEYNESVYFVHSQVKIFVTKLISELKSKPTDPETNWVIEALERFDTLQVLMGNSLHMLGSPLAPPAGPSKMPFGPPSAQHPAGATRPALGQQISQGASAPSVSAWQPVVPAGASKQMGMLNVSIPPGPARPMLTRQDSLRRRSDVPEPPVPIPPK